MKFTGTDSYIASDDLAVAVNAAIKLERPLLVKGEPGTGKTELARQVAESLGLRIIEWHVKSTTRAAQCSITSAVIRFRLGQVSHSPAFDWRACCGP